MEWAYFAAGVLVGAVLVLALKGLFKPVVTRPPSSPRHVPPPHQHQPKHDPAPSPAGRHSVILRDGGPNKILVIKVIRELTGLGLAESKSRVDRAPSIVLQNVSRSEAERAMRALAEAGAEIEIR